jgi:hypothetical protein
MAKSPPLSGRSSMSALPPSIGRRSISSDPIVDPDLRHLR